MIITIALTSELERQLREESARLGVAPEVYVIEAVQTRLIQRQPRRQAQHLSSEEAHLLSQINLGLSPNEWERYHALVEKRKAEILTPDEQTELIALADRLEEANAQRLGYLAELARVRNTTLDAVLCELGLTLGTHG